MKKIILSLLFLSSICLVLCKKATVKDAADADPNARPLGTLTLPTHPNVLFIVVDDLRWWSIRKLWTLDTDRQADNIEPYTPNIDGLMDESITFTRAYAAGVECTPSRTAFLTGLTPDHTGIYRVGNPWDQGQDVVVNQSLIKRFIGASTTDPDYLVYGAGKIYHNVSGADIGKWWFNRPFLQTSADLQSGVTPIDTGNRRGYEWKVINDANEATCPDYLAVSKCLDYMDDAKNNNPNGKPFFIACGIRRPHNPLIVPQKYLTHYPIGAIKTPKVLPVDTNTLPLMGRVLMHTNGCSNDNITPPDVLRQGVPTAWNKYLQAYMACVSFTDAQVGRLLTGLANKGFANNTIVVFISDHGVHLGDKHHIHKTTLWEETTRAPMIWKIPGLHPGTTCSLPVSLMSLYPTLVSYCHLQAPPIPAMVENLTPYLNAPSTAPNGNFAITAMNNHAAAVRGDTWRLIQYDSDVAKEELYHEGLDPWEGTNRRITNPPNPSPLVMLRNHLPSAFHVMIGDPSCGADQSGDD